jgi:hypothetical protein
MTETKTTGIMALLGKRMSKRVKFLGEDVTIFKLTVSEVKEIQEKAKNLETDEEAGLDILRTVIRRAVEGASELQDEHFEQWPMDELRDLSNAIMKYSGIGEDAGK